VARRESKFVIHLSKSFYTKEAINESLVDYKDVCSGDVVVGDYFVVTLVPKEDVGMKVLCGEFCNYVLSLMKNKCLV